MLIKHLAVILFSMLVIFNTGFSQQLEKAKSDMTYSGSLGITTNGFSIIPTFSLNSPAILANFSWRKRNFSIDPDFRLTPNLKRGGFLFWFRYYPVNGKKFNLRIGAHPAFNLQERVITENGITSKISQMRRFLAWELAPEYKLKDNWTLGVYYLQGNGLQKDGPMTTHFITLNTNVSGIRVGKELRLGLYPAVYYLNLDGFEGTYLTATGSLSHIRFPISLESSINQTFHSNLPGNKNFMWCLTLKYNFKKTFKQN